MSEGIWKKYLVERLSSSGDPSTLQDRLNTLFMEGYKLISVCPDDDGTSLYYFEFIGQGYETLPNRVFSKSKST